MRFTETELPGAYLIDLEPHADERGYFARTFCEREFDQHGLCTRWVQCNVSFNKARGTLRGMHYQRPPHEEAKLIRVTRGALYDVIVDLRPESPAYSGYFGVELSAENQRMLYIPAGFAHGFLTLAPDTEVFYQMSAFFEAGSAAGFRYNDPAFAIAWPEPPSVIAERDAAYPDFDPSEARI